MISRRCWYAARVMSAAYQQQDYKNATNGKEKRGLNKN
jgi:hypothetical protein